MRILAIDPGTEKSGVVIIDDGKVALSKEYSNDLLLYELKYNSLKYDLCAIEMIEGYGMDVGKETFITCRWVGRFMERCVNPDCVKMIGRRDIKIYFCNSMKAKDKNVRQAVIDKLGDKGTAKNPGPCYGVSGHMWQALAVALYASENP